MSAAPPSRPPTNGRGLPQANGYARSNSSDVNNSSRASWAGSQGSTGSSDGDRPTRPRYPHIKDLLAKAQTGTNVNIHMPVGSTENLVHYLCYESGRLRSCSADENICHPDPSPARPSTGGCKAGQYRRLFQEAGSGLCRVHNQLRYHPASDTKAQRLSRTERRTWRVASIVSISHQGQLFKIRTLLFVPEGTCLLVGYDRHTLSSPASSPRGPREYRLTIHL